MSDSAISHISLPITQKKDTGGDPCHSPISYSMMQSNKGLGVIANFGAEFLQETLGCQMSLPWKQGEPFQ